MWIFTLQFCEFSVILWSNNYKILKFNRNNIYTHFCYSEILIFKEKKTSLIFSGHKRTPKKNIEKKTIKERFTNKGKIFHQKSLIKFCFLLTLYVYIYMVLAIAGQTAEPNWRKFWGNLWLTKIKLNFFFSNLIFFKIRNSTCNAGYFS